MSILSEEQRSEVYSFHFYMRFEIFRHSEVDIPASPNSVLLPMLDRFSAIIYQAENWMLNIDETTIFDNLKMARDLANKHYIEPIEAELKRRQTDEWS